MNFIYLHTHDTGRYVSPYGFNVPTPHIQAFAEEGVLFRQAFSAAPVCSASRAALLQGNWPHENGMLGLVHRGSRLSAPHHHLAHVLGAAGWNCTLIGEQHVAPADEIEALGYQRVLQQEDTSAEKVALAAVDWLQACETKQPFFLSIGFNETHRPYPPVDDIQTARYVAVPLGLPDTPELRLDMAAYHRSVSAADTGVGRVLAALHASGHDQDTLVILTTDHGLPSPGMKCNPNDAGTGVMLMMRGPGEFSGGKVIDAPVSQLDIYPTLCELAHIPRPAWLRGESLLPLVGGEVEQLHSTLFAEVTAHAAYEPVRSARTERWRYIRRFDASDRIIMANVDASAAKSLFLASGWQHEQPARETLYDLLLDPEERVNLAERVDYSNVLEDMRSRLFTWMNETHDPLLDEDWTLPADIIVVARESIHPEGDD